MFSSQQGNNLSKSRHLFRDSELSSLLFHRHKQTYLSLHVLLITVCFTFAPFLCSMGPLFVSRYLHPLSYTCTHPHTHTHSNIYCTYSTLFPDICSIKKCQLLGLVAGIFGAFEIRQNKIEVINHLSKMQADVLYVCYKTLI